MCSGVQRKIRAREGNCNKGGEQVKPWNRKRRVAPDKCLESPDLHSSQKHGDEVCTPVVIECEITGRRAAAPCTAETSGS